MESIPVQSENQQIILRLTHKDCSFKKFRQDSCNVRFPKKIPNTLFNQMRYGTLNARNYHSFYIFGFRVKKLSSVQFSIIASQEPLVS
jgi:hypothetical protein